MDKNAMLRRIQALGFTLWEFHLYLDTHYNDKEIEKKAEDIQKKLDLYIAEYEEKYGPLTYNFDKGNGNAWLKDPWPWD